MWYGNSIGAMAVSLYATYWIPGATSSSSTRSLLDAESKWALWPQRLIQKKKKKRQLLKQSCLGEKFVTLEKHQCVSERGNGMGRKKLDLNLIFLWSLFLFYCEDSTIKAEVTTLALPSCLFLGGGGAVFSNSNQTVCSHLLTRVVFSHLN